MSETVTGLFGPRGVLLRPCFIWAGPLELEAPEIFERFLTRLGALAALPPTRKVGLEDLAPWRLLLSSPSICSIS